MIIKNGLVHSLDKGFYPDTIYRRNRYTIYYG